jgi:hypothetical protein
MSSRPSHDLCGLKNNINTNINVKLIFLVGAQAPNGHYLHPPLRLGVLFLFFFDKFWVWSQ